MAFQSLRLGIPRMQITSSGWISKDDSFVVIRWSVIRPDCRITVRVPTGRSTSFSASPKVNPIWHSRMEAVRGRSSRRTKTRREAGTLLVVQCFSTHDLAQEYSVVVAVAFHSSSSSVLGVPPQTICQSETREILQPNVSKAIATPDDIMLKMRFMVATDSSLCVAYFFFGSRFIVICSCVTLEATPSFRTSILLIHSSALSTTLRKLSSAQFLW